MDHSDLPGKMDIWVEERHRDITALRFRVTDVLFSGTSRYQTIQIVDTEGFGRMLFNDGAVMLSERDEFVYHDMIAHVPLFVHPAPERVLIIGGGDGGTAREVLRHREVHSCHMVEIDAMVVEACREHLPSTASALDDPRLELIIGDGVRYVEETADAYDVVIVDSTDPVGPAAPLFGKAFYGNVARILGDGGIAVAQAESPFFESEAQTTLLESLTARFSGVHLYNFANMTYPGGLWSFSFASNVLHPLRDFDPDRVKRSGLECRYYNPAVHRAAFALPSFHRQALPAGVNPED